jgi:WbqC-like protein family
MEGETRLGSARRGALAPEYFPGLPFCHAMYAEGTFTVSDRLQYSRQSLQNRARLRTPDGNQWITIPIAGGQFGLSIAETRIDNGADWARRHGKALRFNYASAPYYEFYIDDILGLLDRKVAYLGEITVGTVVWAHRALGCKSRLELDDPTVTSAESPAETTIIVQSYRQNFPGFEGGLSVLDLLMNHGPSSVEILKKAQRKS